jgi:hypothetical protein
MFYYYIIDKLEQKVSQVEAIKESCIAQKYSELSTQHNLKRIDAHNRFKVIFTNDKTFNSLPKKYQKFTK